VSQHCSLIKDSYEEHGGRYRKRKQQKREKKTIYCANVKEIFERENRRRGWVLAIHSVGEYTIET
jgi:hypothetical protein